MKYYKVKVFAYIEPERLNVVSLTAPWYKEGKIFPTENYKVVALVAGWRVRYSVKVYWFRKIKPANLLRLFRYLQTHKHKYPGWLHHANVYEADKFIEQIKL